MLGLPWMSASNCCVMLTPNVADCGETWIVSGCNVTTAVADFVLSAPEVAITVTSY